jgi:phage terminase large subunit-like protein
MLTDPTVTVTRGSTYDNRANLAPQFFAQIVARYEGTRLGRQEIDAQILDALEGALWSREMIQYRRLDVDHA